MSNEVNSPMPPAQVDSRVQAGEYFQERPRERQLKLAFVLGPLDELKAWKDSSVAMMRAAEKHGHDVYAIDSRSLGYRTPEADRLGGVFGEGKQEDELLSEAVRIVIDSGIASISLIQRKLRVGYARAARLVDIMEQHGYVSGSDGSKPRKVLITRAKYAEVFGVDEYNPPEDEA